MLNLSSVSARAYIRLICQANALTEPDPVPISQENRGQSICLTAQPTITLFLLKNNDTRDSKSIPSQINKFSDFRARGTAALSQNGPASPVWRRRPHLSALSRIKLGYGAARQPPSPEIIRAAALGFRTRSLKAF